MIKNSEIIMLPTCAQPLISVIIPVYNVEQYLNKCVISVRSQTYKNLEIILIDDGSTDRSSDICDEHAKLDMRIKVIHKENQGVSSARNIGLKICTGYYIGFVDSDDWLEPQMYEKLVDAISQRESIGVSMCRYFMNYDSKEQEIINRRKVPQMALPMSRMLYYIYRRDEYKGVASYLFTKLFRRSVLVGDSRTDNIRFCESMKIGEDIVFSAECYMRINEAVYINEALYHYRQRESSAMHSYDMRLQTGGSCEAYERIIYLFDKKVPQRVLFYIKRFYVYHASLLLQMAIKKGDNEKIIIYKKKIKKYIGAYIFTNIDHPVRILHLIKLLIAAQRGKDEQS